MPNDSSLTAIDFPAVLANSVHDIKNALSILLGMLEDVVQESTPDDPRYDRLLKLQYEGKRINNDFVQLLALYRVSKDQYFANIAENNVYDFLLEQTLAHELMLAHKQIRADVDCDENLMWFFDREMIAGVINNVINNAYKYSRDRLLLSAKEEDGYLVLSIEDNGPGYPESMLADGTQNSAAICFQNSRTGLGLYFSSLVAAMHRNKNRQGYIVIANDGLEGGGRFSIHIP